jgi:hypothetical protein
MLNTHHHHKDDTITSSVISKENVIISCVLCHQEALIFQHEGNFCLNCWQDKTEPNISINEMQK